MAVDSAIYRFDEVAKHNTAEDLWLIISGKVYDVTQFLTEHPGGRDVLKSASGKDATADFENAGHGPDARELMNKFCIGKFESSSLPKNLAKPEQLLQTSYQPHHGLVMKMLPFVVPFIILSVSFAIRFFNK
ncbi:cytochrome b5-like [Canna indica]|uniref:Cytochrome b5-like n=1 Tax=Canna indica TaxID=4628 RepID=A0AAQ3KL25_9LILI|nr:cytochrome b5-like [Canna indica]